MSESPNNHVTKFGDKIEFKASPGTVLWLADNLEKWIIELSTLDDFDSERVCISKAQTLISAIAQEAKSENPFREKKLFNTIYFNAMEIT